MTPFFAPNFSPAGSPGYPNRPLGYVQVTTGASVFTLASITPVGAASATYVLMNVSGGSLRFRDDGVAPTTSLGMTLASGSSNGFYGSAELAALQFIQSFGTVVLDISFYH